MHHHLIGANFVGYNFRHLAKISSILTDRFLSLLINKYYNVRSNSKFKKIVYLKPNF